MQNSAFRPDERLCGRSYFCERDAIVFRPIVDVHEIVLVGKLAHVAVDRAIRHLDLGVSLEVTHLSLGIRVKRREELQATTSGSEPPDNLPCR